VARVLVVVLIKGIFAHRRVRCVACHAGSLDLVMRPLRRPHPDPAAFDDFYLGARRRLLLQCLALTGDLEASRSAVRDAFVAAQQHWRKVSRLEHPEDWVRPRAWSIAQRRSVARIWHREKNLTAQQTAVLDALAALPDAQRRTVLLTHLAALSLPGIGRELGQTQPVVEQQLQQGTVALALALDCDSALIRAQLESLAPVVKRPGLPRVTVVRRSAQRRHRLHQLTASTLGLALALGAGWFVTSGGPTGANDARASTERARAVERPVTRALLLTAADVRGVHGTRGWHVTATGDNTGGTGLRTPCQQERFADDRGVGAWVRTLRSTGRSPQQVVETVEVSASPRAAMATYRTTVGWYADCSAARGQLLQAWAVHRLGDQARAVQVRVGMHGGTWTVVVARSGEMTTRTALRSGGAQRPPVAPVVATAAAALQRLCAASASGDCGAAAAPRAVPSLPPAGDVPGMLAAPDLPAVPGATSPWVGTTPAPAVPNLAATTCDHTSFRSARSARSRTFLMPEGHLPKRFGLTETYGRFASDGAARAFLAKIRAKMAACAHGQLGMTVSHHAEQLREPQHSSWSLWRETAEINDRKMTVSYWMGVARVGRYVAQLTLTPVGRYDVDEAAFTALVERARDRLRELP
jgi:DNA-directed RNA polymerase specialized sigma24 family protein